VRAGVYEYQSDFARRNYRRGKTEGKAEDILTVLAVRGVAISGEAQTRITSCTDLAQLETWVWRAATVDTADQLFS
jgi:hypothetical protein